MGLLDQAAVSYILTLTKIDQLSATDRAKAEDGITKESRSHTAAYPQVFSTSALKSLGLDALKVHMAALAAT